jgi:hypothetical protein
VPGPSNRQQIAAAGILLVAAVVLGSYLLTRGPSDSDYFGPNEPTWVRVPTTLGDPVYVGILILRAQPGHTVELEGLVVEGITGDAVVAPMVRHIQEPASVLGGIAESDLGGAIDLSTYGPLAGLRFSPADDPVELAVRITGTTPVHGFDGLRLRFSINDGEATVDDRIPMRASVCTGTTRAEAVESCRPIEAEMRSFGL